MTMLLLVLGLSIVMAAVISYGEFRWQSGTRELRNRLEAATLPIEPKVFDSRGLESMPAPVQRYFRAVLKDGQPMIASIKIAHAGQFRLGEKEPKWVPFTSSQMVVTRPLGFDWDARIRMAPGMYAFVHDAYVAGEGILHAALIAWSPHHSVTAFSAAALPLQIPTTAFRPMRPACIEAGPTMPAPRT